MSCDKPDCPSCSAPPQSPEQQLLNDLNESERQLGAAVLHLQAAAAYVDGANHISPDSQIHLVAVRALLTGMVTLALQSVGHTLAMVRQSMQMTIATTIPLNPGSAHNVN